MSVYVTHEGTIQHKICWFYPEIPLDYLVATPLIGVLQDWLWKQLRQMITSLRASQS